MPSPWSKPTSVEVKTTGYDVGDLEVKPTDKTLAEYRDIISKYGLKNDPIESHYCYVPFKGKEQLVIKARGVEHLCRTQVKSAIIVDKPHIDYYQGHPRYVSVTCRIETIDGKTFDDIGCVEVKGSLPVALKHAVTNARMRALRAAIGLNVPDEVTAREILEQEK